VSVLVKTLERRTGPPTRKLKKKKNTARGRSLGASASVGRLVVGRRSKKMWGQTGVFLGDDEKSRGREKEFDELPAKVRNLNGRDHPKNGKVRGRVKKRRGIKNE